MIDARSFVEALQARAGTRVRIELAEAWATFRAGVRGYTGATDARQTLAELLEQASTQGLLVLPRGASGWDRTAQPPLPRWVKLPQARPSAKAEQAGHRSVAWPPELAFVAGLVTCPLLDDYLAVKRFLAAGGRARTPVPMRERSLELFGDEKRLDALLETSAFSPGRLTLELLRCYPVAPPLVWERSPHASRGAPLLIIENLHTYDSFRRWNRDVGEYAAIAYGHGAEFRGTVRDVP
ncbi:MAG: hypothetical protein OXR73_28090, partial [Myxococcales bacterium]|nr:hypothetical protein [Myxococcales bacterium]